MVPMMLSDDLWATRAAGGDGALVRGIGREKVMYVYVYVLVCVDLGREGERERERMFPVVSRFAAAVNQPWRC